MKNNITELVFILDRSGSMCGLEADTVGGFNAMIEKQKKLDGRVYVTTVLFDSTVEMLHDRSDIEKIEPMREEDFTVGGCTALVDAIGSTIRHIAKVHKYARAEDVPERTVFVITTDGMENASRRYTAQEVRRMIEKEERKYGWEFLFLGANIDAVETAGNFGIRRERAVNYRATRKGTEKMYGCVSDAVISMRCDVPLSADWGAELEKED